MLRYIILLFLLASCAANTKPTKEIIPTKEITTQSGEAIIEDHKLHIALLVPLNKEKETVAASLIKAAQLAVSEASNADVDLALLDSSLITSNPQELKDTIEEKNITTIIGPLYSKETEQLISLTRGSGITILSLSNDTSITGKSLLTLGISPDNQAKTLVYYAIAKGINHFYVLVPANKYGKLVANAVGEVVDQKYETIRTIRWYEQDYPDLAIEKLLHEIARNQDNSSKAIIMPQGGKNLAKLNQALEAAKLKIQLIGSQSWDHPDILKYSAFNDALLVRKNLVDHHLSQQFQHLFKLQPNNIDLIAYNAIKMLANMHQDNLTITKKTIIENNQFSGKYSNVTFAENGASIYKLEIVEAHEGRFRVIGNE